jgi:hypothetical protein
MISWLGANSRRFRQPLHEDTILKEPGLRPSTVENPEGELNAELSATRFTIWWVRSNDVKYPCLERGIENMARDSPNPDSL